MPTRRPLDSDTLYWQYDIPLLTNRYIVWDMLRVLALSMFALVALTWLISAPFDGPVLLPIEFLLLVGGILVGLFVVVALGLFGNRYRARFVLDARQAVFHGVGWGDRRRDRVMKRLLKVLAFFAAQSDPTLSSATAIRWHEVRKVKVNPATRVIALCDGWHVVIRLYCPPEVFDLALAHVQQHTGNVQALSVPPERDLR